MRNYYQVLGVAERARPDEIRHAYRRAVRRLHPDATGSSDASSFCQVREAYETLSDADRRRAYDARLAATRRTLRPTPTPARSADWLTDEVAIDFPSVFGMLERIRRGLAEPFEDRLPLAAEILLTRREATFGVEVPLEVPVRGTCPGCDGRGEVWAGPCDLCTGSGTTRLKQRIHFPVPPGVSDGARFRLNITDELSRPVVVDVRIVIAP